MFSTPRSTPRTVSEIADRSDNYRNTVNRVLKRFRDRGLVGTADGRYEFNADFDRLHEFARELTHQLHRQCLEAVAPKGTVLWEDYDELLTRTETEIDAEAFHETGLARFAAFDLQFLLTDHRYYVYSEELDAVSPAELCCHTLLIDDGPGGVTDLVDRPDRRVRLPGHLERREHLLGAFSGQFCEFCVRAEGVGCLVARLPRVEDEQNRHHVGVEAVEHDLPSVFGGLRPIVGK